MKQLTQKLKSGQMQVLEAPIPALGRGMVLVRNCYSLISAGTEAGTVKAARKGYIGKAKERPQQVKQVIDSLKSQGPVQTYRAVMKKLDAYSPLGYSSAGVVIEVGEGVWGFAVGDKVACAGVGYANHAEVVSVPVNLCVKLPQRSHSAESKAQSSDRNEESGNSWDNYLKIAAYNTLGAIAMQGVRQADLRLGETCAVIGMGLLGQLTSTLLRTSGVKVVGIDIDPAMVKLGEEHCLDCALLRDDPGIDGKILEFSNGIGCDAVIITAASKSLDPINFAGAILRKKATIVVVGDIPTGFDREPYFYKKELTVKMSCSYGPGRYDPEYEDKGRDYPVGYVRWTEKRNMQAFQELIGSGKIDIGYLTTHVFKLEDAPKAYDMIVEKSEPFVGILIEYDPQITQITQKEKDKLATDTRRHTQTLQEDVSRKGAKALRGEDPHPSGIRSAVTSEFHGAGITQTKITVKPSAISHQPSAISIGFIGAGSYAQSCLLPNIPKGKDVALKGVMTSTSTSSRSVADRFGFEFCTGNEEDILQNDEINTVFIATRHDSHGYYVKKALEAGKNVFVEKPLCLTEEELEEIRCQMSDVGDQRSEGRHRMSELGPPLLMVGYNRRFSPLTKIIKGKITTGPMSMIYRVNAGAIPADSWIQDKEIGGGRIIGEVCHFIDFMTFFASGRPVRVFASAMPDPHRLNDTVNINLEFENGSIGTVSYFANGSKNLPKEYFEIYSSGMTGIIRDFKELNVYGSGRPYRKKLLNQNKGQAAMVKTFIENIKAGGQPLLMPDEIFGVTLATFAVIESLKSKKAIVL